MAIVRNLEVGSVLWKYETTVRRRKTDPTHPYRSMTDERGRIIYEDVPEYHIVKLYNRRNRNTGCVIAEELIPFFEKLKVRIYKPHQNSRAIAVGCSDDVVTKEYWDSIELDEVAQKYYNRIKNSDLKKMIKLEKGEISTRPVEELRNLDLSERSSEEDEWPDEPIFTDTTPYYIRNGRYYH